MYIRIDLATTTAIGEPGPLPAELVGLDNETLANLPAALDPVPPAFAGAAYWPAENLFPAYDPAEQAPTDEITDVVLDTDLRTATVLRGTRALSPEEVAVYRNGLRAHAAAARYAKETGGITVAGIPVQTDRESQGLINGALALVTAAPDTVIRFKAAGGFVDLNAAAMTAIAVSVGQHVQAAFATEADVGALIDAGEITTAAEIDEAFA